MNNINAFADDGEKECRLNTNSFNSDILLLRNILFANLVVVSLNRKYK